MSSHVPHPHHIFGVTEPVTVKDKKEEQVLTLVTLVRMECFIFLYFARLLNLYGAHLLKWGKKRNLGPGDHFELPYLFESNTGIVAVVLYKNMFFF